MKKKPVYVMVAVIVAIVGVIALTLVNAFLNHEIEDRDPIIQKYAETLHKYFSEEEAYHLKEEVMISDVAGQLNKEESNEYYSADSKNYLIIQGYSETGDEVRFLVLDDVEYMYSHNVSHGEPLEEVIKDDDVSYWTRPLNTVANSYYNIVDEWVTYEETENQYILTYNNKEMLVAIPSGYKEESGKVKKAESICYFDKNWNLKQMVVTMVWDSMTEEGVTYERTEITTLTYQDTSEEEIQKRLEEEKDFLDSLLK